MKIKTTAIFKKHFFIQLLFVFFAGFSLSAQFIEAPTFTGTNNICAFDPTTALPNANKFTFNFKFSGFGAGATFILELSDANGSFASPTTRDSGFFSSSPQNLILTVPSNFVGGNKFKLRVRSGSVVSGVEQELNPSNVLVDREYKIYFKLTELPLSINNGNGTATICGNLGVLLSVDDPAIVALTSLRFIWFKDNVVIPNQTGSSLIASQSGIYQVKYDYGPCSGSGSGLESQLVTVSFSTVGASYTITSSIGNVVETGVPTTLSTPLVSGNTYKWFRDGTVISGQTSNSLVTDQVGTYYLEITDSSCVNKSNSITLKYPLVLPIGTIIPNIVSPNNDGDNDFWILPSQYIIGTGTKVQILDSTGKIDFTSENYLNDWPQTTIDFESVNPVYYYILTPLNGIIKKGSITVIK